MADGKVTEVEIGVKVPIRQDGHIDPMHLINAMQGVAFRHGVRICDYQSVEMLRMEYPGMTEDQAKIVLDGIEVGEWADCMDDDRRREMLDGLAERAGYDAEAQEPKP